MEVGNMEFTWKIKNFSNLQDKRIYSDVFSFGPCKWQMYAYPKRDNTDNNLSFYLKVVDSKSLPFGWSLKAKLSFTLTNQIDDKSSLTKSEDKVYEFKVGNGWGYTSSISRKELLDLKKGYLVDDTCIIKVDVTLYGDDYFESHVSRNEIKNVDSTESATEEDIDAFIGDLRSVISANKVFSSEEEAKEALAVVEEASNMAPTDLNNPGKISQLKDALDVLSLLGDGSILTSEQKAEFMDLPERAAKAASDIKLFTEHELVKKTLHRKLGKCLAEFEKAKADTLQSEQNIATLLSQIDEMKKKKEDSSSKQKEMFKLSKELKEELDVLVKNFPEYEAKMKAAREEEKIVSMKWDKMKEVVSSLDKYFYIDALVLLPIVACALVILCFLFYQFV